MSFLSSFFKKDKVLGTEPHIEQQITPDPYKVAVSSPLSGFLSKQIGTGIGEMPTDPNYTNRYNEYLSMNPSEYFDTNIAKPAYEQFNKYAKPLIDEGYAGSLRGSGHYGAEEAGLVGLGEDLANTKAQFVPQFAQSQLQQGQTEFARQYSNWYNSLPVNNPALKASIDFLNSDSGYNIYSALNPGKQGWLNDLLKSVASSASSAAASGG